MLPLIIAGANIFNIKFKLVPMDERWNHIQYFLKCSEIQSSTGKEILYEMQNCFLVITANTSPYKCFTQSESLRGKNKNKKQGMVLCNIINLVGKAYLTKCLNEMKKLALITLRPC